MPINAPAVPPPVVALTAAVAQRLLTPHRDRPGPARLVASMALFGGAVALAGSASGQFRRAGTTFDPHRPETSTALVTEGVYGLTRNPIYLGFATVLLAHATYRGSPLALLPLAAYVAWIDRVQIPAEEAALRELFGTEWEAYRRRVGRWGGLPGGPSPSAR